jgi:3-oxoadipate enol-lactonase
VVLLHGWFASGGLNWYQAFRPLSAHFRVIAPDLRGHGRGLRGRRRFRLSDCADDLAATLDEMEVDQAVMCGFSMGGPVAQLVWRRHRERVSGLVLSATASSFIPGLQQRMIFAGMMGMAASTTRIAQAVSWLPGPVRNTLPVGFRSGGRPSSMERWAAQEMRRHDLRMLMEAGGAISSFNSRRWLHEVAEPTAVLVTTKDRAIPPAEQLKLAIAIPHAQILRYDEGHTSPVLDSFGAAITDACLSVGEPLENSPARRRRR